MTPPATPGDEREQREREQHVQREEPANREREAAGRTKRVVEASLQHRGPTGVDDCDRRDQHELQPAGARAEGDEEQPGRRSAGAQVRETVYAPEQRDHGCRADEAGSGPDGDGETRRRRRAYLVDEVERHEAEEGVEKQVGELDQQPTEDLPLDEQAQRLANPWAVVVAVRVRSTDREHHERKGERREREEECAPAKV